MSRATGIGVAVAGWGMAVPGRRVTNHDLALRVDTSDAWIVERTGIRERRWVGAGESTATLAIDAGAAAIKQADMSASDIACCIVCTCTPEQPIPPTSAFVQDSLGLRCGAFDIDAACSGFVYGLVAGAALVGGAGFGPVLLIGAETLSRFADPDDRSTCILFGDGAGAVVLVASEERNLLAWDLDCDGSGAPLLGIPAGGSRQPVTVAAVEARDHFLKMDGKEVFRRAVRAMVASGEAALAKAGIAAGDLTLWIPHQANSRIIDATATRLGLPPDKVFVNVDRYGNTSAASVPICLAEAADQGRLDDGDLVMVSGVGAGMSWATAVIRWGR